MRLDGIMAACPECGQYIFDHLWTTSSRDVVEAYPKRQFGAVHLWLVYTCDITKAYGIVSYGRDV